MSHLGVERQQHTNHTYTLLLSLCSEGCGSVDTLPRFQCTGQRTKSQRDARMSIYVTRRPRQCMSNKDTQGCSALDPDQRTKYLRHAGMSIYVTGSPRQYMSNKDSQECSALVPKTRVRPSESKTRGPSTTQVLGTGGHVGSHLVCMPKLLFYCFTDGEVSTYSN